MNVDELYVCAICHRAIFTEARGGPHPSPGDHETGPHVAKAYGLAEAMA